MKRVGRLTLNALAGLSLLLFAAAVVLWVRSYFAHDVAFMRRVRVGETTYREAHHSLYSKRGRLVWNIATTDYGTLPPGVAAQIPAERRKQGIKSSGYRRAGMNDPGANPVAASAPWWTQRGFRYRRFVPPPQPGSPLSYTYTDIGVPHWALVAAASVLPAAVARRRWRERRRRRAGVCAKCGYDLRATPERCPECGAAAAQVC